MTSTSVFYVKVQYAFTKMGFPIHSFGEHTVLGTMEED